MTSLPLFTFLHWRRKWQPTPVFLPGESQGQGWWAAVCGVAQSRTRLKRLSSSSSSSSAYTSMLLSQFGPPSPPCCIKSVLYISTDSILKHKKNQSLIEPLHMLGTSKYRRVYDGIQRMKLGKVKYS